MKYEGDSNQQVPDQAPDSEQPKKRPRKTFFDANAAAVAFSRNIPPAFRNAYLKAVTGRATPRSVIKANCQFCVGYESVSQRIRECGSTKCPAWLYRPYQK